MEQHKIFGELGSDLGEKLGGFLLTIGRETFHYVGKSLINGCLLVFGAGTGVAIITIYGSSQSIGHNIRSTYRRLRDFPNERLEPIPY